MSKVASAAAAMGVGEDQLAAQLSTIISVTRQAPESVGTALRTIYARISDIKAGIDEDGVSLGNYSGKMATLGFNVLDVNGKLRDMGEVIEEIGGKWQTLTREQQVSLAQTMAGQRQYSNLIALFDNFQEYNRALNIAQNAAGTLQEQQDTYLESTRAHLNQLKTAVEDLYDSLLNPDSLEPLIDGLAKAASFGAKFVDSLGGGGAILTSLGAIGISVFSEQIAKGINTTITNFEIAKRNAQQFDAILQTIQQWKGIEGLDQTTRSLLENRQQILSLSKLMTPEQFSGMQGILNEITQTSSRLASIKDQKGFLDSALKKITGLKTETEALNAVMKDANAQQQIINRLKDQENAFTVTASKLNDYRVQIQQMNVENGAVPAGFDKIKDSIGKEIVQISKLAETGAPLEAHRQQIANLIKEFGSLKDNVPADQLRNKLMGITATLEGLYTSGSGAAEQLRQKLSEEFAETARSLGYSEKEIEETLNKLNKAFQDSSTQIKRTINIQDITNLIGSFAQFGAVINQVKNSGEAFANGNLGQGITNITTSISMLVPAAIRAGKAMETLKLASSALSGGIFAGVAVAAIGATAAIIKYADAQNEIAITNHKNVIQEENDKQQQIQKNKQLYSSLEDLNKKYDQGQLTRIELKSTIEDLIDQYQLEGIAADRLRQNYNNLTQAIQAAREEAARQAKTSAERQRGQAQQLVLDTAKGTVLDAGRQVGNQYQLALSPGNTIYDEPEYIKNLFLKSGAHFDENGNLRYEVDFTSGSVVQLYDTIDSITSAIERTDQLTDAQKNSSEFYKDAVKWLQQMEESVEKYRDALQDVSKYSTELTALTSVSSGTIDLTNITTANDYLRERITLIEEIQKMLDEQGNTEADAAAMADAYIRQNYRSLYNEYDQARRFIEELRTKFKSSNTEIENLISKLDSDSLNYLKSYDLNDISNWKQLKSIIEYLTDPSNAQRLVELSSSIEPGSATSAQETYDLYSSLSDQISNSKKRTISKKEFGRLDPQIQEFFSLMANGQYKMTGDAKEFYETVNNLSLSGFKDNINNILKEEERLKNILSAGNETEYLSNIRESLNNPELLTADSEIFDLLSHQGYDVVPWMSNINWQSIKQMQDALDAIEKQGINFTEVLKNLDTELYSNQYAMFSSADSIKQLNKLYDDAKQSLQDYGATTEQVSILTQAFSAAAIDLNKELDLASLDTTQLQNYANYLQEIANESEDLSNDLAENADAAEIVAKIPLFPLLPDLEKAGMIGLIFYKIAPILVNSLKLLYQELEMLLLNYLILVQILLLMILLSSIQMKLLRRLMVVQKQLIF